MILRKRKNKALGEQAKVGNNTKASSRRKLDVGDLTENKNTTVEGDDLYTLDEAEVRFPNYSELKDALSTSTKAVSDYTINLHNRNRRMFRRWLMDLLCGFSLLLYGYGSKIRLLEELCVEYFQDVPRIVVYGFSPSANLQKFLEVLISTAPSVFKNDTTTRSYLSKVKSIVSYYNSDSAGPLCILVHNIDGRSLRNEKFQWVLATLSTCKGILLLASVDHINATALWNSKLGGKFNWKRHEVHTFESYITEMSFSEQATLCTATASLQSALSVLRCLTPTANSVFKLLIEKQLARTDASSSGVKDEPDNFKRVRKLRCKEKIVGIPYSEVLEECLELLLVSNEYSLEQHLQEFKDHKLISFTKLPNSTGRAITVSLLESDMVGLIKSGIWPV